MKSIGTRFLLPFGLVAVVFSVFVLYRAHAASERYANDLVSQQAGLALEFNLAIRDYAGAKIRPVMEGLVGRDGFVRETMSPTFISRSIFEAVQREVPECVIRFASDRPRNPVNAANADELRMIEFFRKNPEVSRHTEEVEIDGRRYLAHFVPKRVKEECLRCHGDPKDAPAELLERYGTTASFHRRVGDVAGVDTVAVPLDTAKAELTSEVRQDSLILVAGLVVLFGSVMVAFRFVVTRRLGAMASHFQEIADHTESPWMTPVEAGGNDEIGVVGAAFNRLIERLRVAQTSLEQRVSERTAELQSVNEQLRVELAERKRAEEALSRSRSVLAHILNSVPQSVFWKDRHSLYLGCNEAFARMAGVDNPEAIVGKTDYDLPWVGEEAEAYRADDREVMENNQAKHHIVETLRQGGGKRLCAETTKIPLTDDTGGVYGILGVCEDITERKRAEAERNCLLHDLNERVKELTVLRRVAGMLQGERDVDEEFLKEIASVLPAGWQYPEICEARVSYGGLQAATPGWRETSWRQTETFATEDGTTGAIEVVYTEERPNAAEGPFLAEERNLIESLSDMLSAYLERQVAEEALRQSEAKFEKAFQSSPAVMSISTIEEGRFVEVNESFVKKLGYSREEIIGKTALELNLYADPGQRAAYVRSVRECGRVRDMEVSVRTRTGEVRQGLFSVESIELGDQECLLAVVTDVTETKRAEEAIRQSEKKFATTFQNSPAVMAITTIEEGRFVDVNESFVKTLGYSREEAIGRTVLELNIYVDPGRRADFVRSLRERGSVREFEIVLRTKQGELRHGLFGAEIIELGDQECLLTVVNDVTERKRSERVLRESEERYRRITAAVTDYIYTVEVENGRAVRTVHSPACAAVTGHTAEEFAADPYLWLRMVAEEDRAMVNDWVTRILAGEDMGSIEHRIRRKDGEVRWISNTSVPHRNAGGTLASYDGLVRDITERKQAEEALRRSEEKFEKAFQNSPVLKAISTIEEGRYIEVNECFVKTVGYSREEAVGRTAQELGIYAEPGQRTEWIRCIRERGSVRDVEIDVRTKEGELRHGLLSAEVIELGDQKCLLTIVNDVTEARRTEQVLRESEQKLRSIIEGSPIGTFVIDNDHRVIHWNKALEKLTGIRGEEVTGTKEQWRAFYDQERPCMADLLLDGRKEMIHSWYSGRYSKSAVIPEAYEATDFFPTAGKEGRWLRFTAAATRDSSGKLVGAVETLEDVTERKLAEEALRQEKEFTETAINTMPGGFFVVDREGRYVRWNRYQEALVGVSAEEMRGTLALDKVHEDDRALVAGKLGECFEKGRAETEARVRVRGRDSVRHFYIMARRMETGGKPYVAGCAIDITELKKAEEALQEEKRFTEAVIDSMPGTFVVIGRDGRYVRWNRLERELAGVPDEQMRETDALANAYDEDRALLERAIEECFEKGQATAEARLKGPDGGATRTFAFTGRACEVGGEPYVVACGIDITEKKRAEEALRLEREFTATAINTMPGGFFVVDREGRFVRWNGYQRELLGITEEEMLGSNALASVHEEDRAVMVGKLAECLEKGQGETEARVPVKGGEGILHFYIVGRRMEIGGEPYVVGCGVDITERKRVEKELADARILLEQTFEQTPIPMVLVSMPDTIIRIANTAARRYLGATDEPDPTGTPLFTFQPSWKDFDAEGNFCPMSELPLARAMKGKFTLGEEYSVVTKNGEKRWELVSGAPIYNDQGDLIAAFIAFPDITERKRAEEELRSRMAEIEMFNRLAVGRERRMIELKGRINDLSRQLGQTAPYDTGPEGGDGEDERQWGEASEPAGGNGRTKHSESEEGCGSRLSELLDAGQMQRLLDSFCDAAGISAALIDLKGDVFVEARWQRICTDFHRMNAMSFERCIASDAQLARKLRTGEEFTIYRCRNGLTEATSPIMIGGEHVANVFVGQFLLEGPDVDSFRRQAAECGFDEAAYLAAMEAVPVVPKDKLHPILDFLASFAELVGTVGLERMQAREAEERLARHAEAMDGKNQELRRQRKAAMNLAQDAEEARAAAARSEAELAKAKERLETASTAARVALWDWDVETRVLEWSDVVDSMLGCDLGGLARTITGWEDAIHPEDRQRVTEALAKHVEAGATYDVEYRIRRADGEYVWWRGMGTAKRKEDGTAYRMSGACIDVTERKRAEEALRKSEERYRTVFESAPVGIIHFDEGGTISECNAAFANIIGAPRERIVGFNVLEGLRDDEMRGAMAAALGGRTGHYEGDYESVLGGKKVSVRALCRHVASPEGRVMGGMTILEDITERRRAERERNRLFNMSVDMMCVAGFDGCFKQVNPAGRRMLGWTEEELMSRPWLDFVHPDDRQATIAAGEELRAGRSVTQFENRYRCKDGTYRWISWNSFPLPDENMILAVARDMTARKQEEAERARLEEQLRQSQKLEAVGTLAGGVAHDFNNLLTAILGNVELLKEMLPAEQEAKESLGQIEWAGQRAATLTRQLLAFSRRQTVRPEVLDLNHVVREMEKIIRRLIGEDVRLQTVLRPDLGLVRMDAGQIEQVILNLAINSRDAMPAGGRLGIETANVVLDETYASVGEDVKPGRYVVLSVSDTGCGMDAATRERLFEPFFTTKPMGKGTGLGLSVVFGIVKQAGGHIGVTSQPGKGSTFRIYLPLAEGGTAAPGAKTTVEKKRGGDETILLVEDEEGVRTLTRRMLERQGYRVLAAENGARALELAREHEGRIDLLVTDVVMPDMDGAKLAEALEERISGLKVLYVSGYAPEMIMERGRLKEGADFMGKPFHTQDLLKRVREVLDK